jgi:hypothetical protein
VPRIELIDPVYYQPNDPYHWEIDNLPLKSILSRQNLINLALDNVIQEMRDAIGTQGSVANRLNQSIDEDGRLKSSAIDMALHSIEEHTDTDDYVRMTKSQSDRLDLMADGATNVALRVYTDEDSFVDFDAGVVEFQHSTTITATVDSPNIVKLHMAFPTEAAHQHFYGIEPLPVDSLDPDYINYKVNSTPTPYIEGTLRVQINGIRIFSDAEVYAPGSLVSDAWTLLSFTEDADNGLFELSAAITEDDVIRIDFDRALT